MGEGGLHLRERGPPVVTREVEGVRGLQPARDAREVGERRA